MVSSVIDVARIPCGTALVSRRGVSICTVIRVIKSLLGLLVTALLLVAMYSGLVLCKKLVLLSSFLVTVACHVCYVERCSRYQVG